MTTPNVTENGNSDFEGITDLLNRQLKNQEIKVEVDRKNRCIYVLLESCLLYTSDAADE